MGPRQTLALFLAAVFALGGVWVIALQRDGDEVDPGSPTGSEFEGALLPPGLRAADFDLTDQEGRPISMSRFRGKPVALTFLYTECDDSCPPQAQQIRGALDELGHDIPAVAIAVDPPNDTPESARRFLAEQRMAGRLDWALGSRRELARVWKAYSIQPQTRELEHQARIELIDRRGFRRIGFPLDQATPERLAHDIRLLENE